MNQNKDVLKQFKMDYEARFQPKSLALYHRNVEKFFDDCQKAYIDVHAADIRNWVAKLFKMGQKPATIRTQVASIRLFYQYCMEEEWITEDPSKYIAYPRIEDKLPYYLDRKQLGKLREITKDKPRDRAIIETLYATGVRVSELVSIQKTDINWDERKILIPKGKGKKARIVCFTRECEGRLQAYLEQRMDVHPSLFVSHFIKPLNVRTIQKVFETYSEKLGKKITPHTLRHTFAAHLSEKGMPPAAIQDFLGHESQYQTHVYARLSAHARKRVYDQYL
ncbi:integrase [Lentibacillus lipolyticus]|nr:integrase [Lentibacillus lipolyticus]